MVNSILDSTIGHCQLGFAESQDQQNRSQPWWSNLADGSDGKDTRLLGR